jgi:hypothetical protein
MVLALSTNVSPFKFITMRNLFFFLFCWLTIPAIGQVLQGDAEGKSSLVVAGKTLGIDLGKSSLSFAMNNYGNEKKAKANNHLLWGTSLSASNKESVAKLFENSDFSTGFRATGIIGYSKTNANLPNTNDYDRERNELDEHFKQINEELKKQTENEVAKISMGMTSDKAAALKKDALDIVTTQNRSDFPKLFAGLDTKYNTGSRLADFGKQMQLLAELLYRGVEESYERWRKSTHQKLLTELKRYWKTRHTTYFSASFGFDQYSLYNGNLNVDFDDRFYDSDNLSKELLLGYNYERGAKYKIGASAGVHFTDNNSKLTKETYKNEQLVTFNGLQMVRQLKEKEAYNGVLKLVTMVPINIDYLRFFNPEGDRSLVIAWHVYGRQKFSTDKDVLPTTTNVGTGLYFFKQGGVFAGGFYFEAPDLANNIEKAKTEPDLKPIYQRLNFSVVGKFAFSSLLGY